MDAETAKLQKDIKNIYAGNTKYSKLDWNGKMLDKNGNPTDVNVKAAVIERLLRLNQIAELKKEGYFVFLDTFATIDFELIKFVIFTVVPFFKFFWNIRRLLLSSLLLTIFLSNKVSLYIMVNPSVENFGFFV